MVIQLATEVADRDGRHCGRISRLIANQTSRQIEEAVLRLNNGREIELPATAFSSGGDGSLRVALSSEALSDMPEFDASAYYALHPVEWQEEWGAVQGEILTLYPPQDVDRKSRRRFILGSLAIIGAIAASLVYPIARYLLFPLSKGLPRLWIRLKPQRELLEDTPVFVTYKVHRVEGYLEETIPKGVWLIRPSALLASQIAARGNTLRFPEVGWANEKDSIIAFSPKCPHLGCNVHWSSKEHAFLCPCHGSRFSLAGKVIAGPAPRGLDTLPVRMWDGGIEVMDMEFRAGIPDKKRSA